MTWPPKSKFLAKKDDRKSWVVVARALLIITVLGCAAFGICRMFFATEKALGWAILAALAVAGIQGFNYCTTRSARDNNGGASVNRDAFNGGPY